MLRFIGYLALQQSKHDDLENKNSIGLTSNLKEYLLPDQKIDLQNQVEKEYPTHDNYMTPKARNHTDHFFGKGNDHIKEDLKDYEPNKSEIHKSIEQHLNRDISHDDYVKGTIKDRYGRERNIGKAIKTVGLRNKFASDNVRAGGYNQQKKVHVTIARGVEVGGQTNSEPNPEHPKGHSWKNCKDIGCGINKHYLKHEIANGSIVVRVHDHNNQEIYRSTLHPHHNETGESIYKIDSEYGVKNPAFTNHSNDVANRLSGEYKTGIFKKSNKVYSNNGQEYALHPNAPKEDIDKHLNHEDPQVRSGIAFHNNLSEPQIDKVLTDKRLDVRLSVLGNKNINVNHITKALQDKESTVRESAIKNPIATTDHITQALQDKNKQVKLAALQHPKLTTQHMIDASRDNDIDVSIASSKKYHDTFGEFPN